MNKLHDVKIIEITEDQLILEVDTEMKAFDLKEISSKLSAASELEKTTYEISPSGYGIHWPLIDEDISIDGLLGILHQPEPEKMRA